jgi:hypothetical protein
VFETTTLADLASRQAQYDGKAATGRERERVQS